MKADVVCQDRLGTSLRETSKNGGRCCCWVILLLAEVRRQVETLDEVSMADIHLEIGTIRDEDVAGEAPLHPPVTPSGLRSVRWRRRA